MTVAIGSSQKTLNNLFSFSSLATTLSTSILGASPSSSSSSSNSSSTISTLTNYSPSPSLSSSSTVTLTRFNHRRSSFDYGNDDDNIDNTGFKSEKLPVAGLSNLGNTCYMNSVLQALFATKPFRDYIMAHHENGQLYSALSRLFKEMSSSIRHGHVNPSQFRSTFIQLESKFNGCEQQDAQEFLSYVINDLHDELNKPKSRSRSNNTMIEPKSAQEAWSIYRSRYDDSKLVDIFVGQYASVIKCSYCGNESTCWDPFWDLPLPVPRNRNRIDIDECIAEFTAAEILDGNEQPFCSRCKQHRRSTKRLSIVRSPKILVIHLKKFSNNGYKLSSDINVNQQIRIDNGSTTMATYELYGCVCHHGYLSRSGHYTAYCQYDQQRWYHCDDQKVRDCTNSFSMATLKDSYVLFYRQQQLDHHYSSRL
uniref:ubiquitinyl hydrolase 1 n=2 Tax=Dermatophagoides pteronyssinus TaxID=6956 RepID=A0A6P6YHP4_DERPT|nr:ubiquitin carboxyl-terminal hydrolase 10-like isoform X1 [Dermatophagoides pteronyssinus]